MCAQVGRDSRSVAAVAADYGISWSTAWAAVTEADPDLVEDPERVRPTEAIAWTRRRFDPATTCAGPRLVTGVVDVGRGQLVDVFAGRDAC